jgi:hypothetical protein
MMASFNVRMRVGGKFDGSKFNSSGGKGYDIFAIVFELCESEDKSTTFSIRTLSNMSFKIAASRP